METYQYILLAGIFILFIKFTGMWKFLLVVAQKIFGVINSAWSKGNKLLYDNNLTQKAQHKYARNMKIQQKNNEIT